MRKTTLLTGLLLAALSMEAVAWAADTGATKIVEGTFADTLYASQKDKTQTLSQIDTHFILKKSGTTNIDSPTEITVKPAEFFFIKNDEATTVHNVYDDSDTSWLLQKQMPGSVAAIMFTKPGVHHLLCAIHPQMQITVNVVQ